ncbi:MAG TPA: 2-succinyl-5-enolpyruvyl-6-hydroxy-3-cyclohexene-1-carboxylic-acid synthase [Opitutaceae bacterium]|jgi:2-succinyl-5-enolpyruvyl-6-hydroxy-3-cyclohexene-1-carboxylate synthase
MIRPRLDLANANAAWGGVLAETLARCGVAHAVISPGSRSTPLAFAFAANPSIEAVPVLDERSAAFFALGIARRTLRPVVLVCTSGTAGANYFPAVIEAQEAGVPLLVITADRPPEMRGCASGQTIDQQRLYGGHVNFYHELAVPEATLPMLRYLRQTVAHAAERTLSPFPGPVHLNAPFRDPLPPLDDGGAARAALEGTDWDEFFSHLAPAVPAHPEGPAPALGTAVMGVIVAGPCNAADPEDHARAVGELSRRLGWPVLADALSQLRGRAPLVPHLVTAYDAILRSPAAAQALRPEAVLCLGDWPTSKVLRAWAEASGAPVYLVSERPGNRDALHGATRRLATSVAALAGRLVGSWEATGYEQLWATHEARARASLDARLAQEEALVEPKAAWLLAGRLPRGSILSVASSMPVRDLEFFWPAGDNAVRVAFNRGANGIDGTLSCAMGTAHGGPPSALLTGDLAFLHDSNGLLIAPRLRGSLTVVLVNNRGGGIFEHLPVARFGRVFEEYFATPQEVDVSRLCSAHGIPHFHVEDWPHFESLVAEKPRPGLRVLEIAADRKRDAEWRRQAFASAAGIG